MNSALVSGYIFDGSGKGRAVDWEAVQNWSADQGILWVHLNHTVEDSHQWVQQESGMDPISSSALLAEDTRPRFFATEQGLLIILRGVNLNPGAEPDDMVSIRVWLEPNRIISLRHRRIMAVEDIRDSLERGTGPKTPSDFLVQLAVGLNRRIGDVLEAVEDAVDTLEDEVLAAGTYEQRGQLSNLRRQNIRLRRYLAPQREALNRLQMERSSLLSDLDRIRLREVADHITRYVEDIDAAKDRAAVCQEELENRMSAQANRTLYILSIVTVIFLPLGLITGLLGINVGGIPGTDNPLAFTAVCALLGLISIVQILIFRRIRWV